MKLYKYQSVNQNSISSLVNKYVWFSKTSEFNDAFDSYVIQSEFLCNLVLKDEVVYCLSSNVGNVLMWSHYADSHQGFCIEFTDYSDEEIEILKKNDIYPNKPNSMLPIIRNFKKVEYKSIEDIEAEFNTIPNNEEAFMNMYNSMNNEGKLELSNKVKNSSFVKNSDWSYEDKYRFVGQNASVVAFPGKISAIYFGMKMSSLNKRMIGMIVNPNFSPDIKFYQMFRPENSFRLVPKEFNIKSDLDIENFKS